MSIKLMSQVMESKLPPFPTLVALVCADHARDDGSKIFPSVNTIVRKTRLSRSTVQRQLRLLEEWKVLAAVKKQPGRSIEYHMDPSALQGWHPGGGVTQTRGGCHTEAGGCQADTGVPQADTLTINEPSINHQRASTLANHTFEKFKTFMPLRNGKFLEEEACRGKWAGNPARWNQWIAAVKNYATSREVRDGAVCSPMTFLTRKWKDWEQQESEHSQPLGQEPQHGPYDRSWLKERKRDEEISRQSKGRQKIDERCETGA